MCELAVETTLPIPEYTTVQIGVEWYNTGAAVYRLD